MAWAKAQSETTARTATTAHKKRRKRVLERADYRCEIAGPTCLGDADICDHIIALALGGSDTDENCQAACWNCHQVKTLAEAAEGLRRKSTRRAPLAHPGGRPA